MITMLRGRIMKRRRKVISTLEEGSGHGLHGR